MVSISILYFNLGLGEDYVFYGSTEFRGLHDNEPLIFRRRREDKTLEKFKSQDIFPEYDLINVECFADVMKSDLDEWIYWFKHATLPPHYQAKNLDKVSEKLDVLKMSVEERHGYDLYLMALVNEQDAIDTARNKGLQEGRKKDYKKDEKKVNLKGKLEGKLEIAKKLLDSGMDIETVAAMTNLSPNDIKAETP